MGDKHTRDHLFDDALDVLAYCEAWMSLLPPEEILGNSILKKIRALLKKVEASDA